MGSPGRTQEAGDLGIGSIGGVQVHFVGVQPCRGYGQVAAQPVDVPDQGHVHLQGPLAAGFLGVPGVEAGAPGGKRRRRRRGLRGRSPPLTRLQVTPTAARPPTFQNGGRSRRTEWLATRSVCPALLGQ